MDIGKKIALCRKEAHMSQEALAAELGISRQAVSRWETGEAVPDTAKVIELSRIFSVSTDYLLLDEIKEAKSKYEIAEDKREQQFRERQLSEYRTVLGFVLALMGLSCVAWYFIVAWLSTILCRWLMIGGIILFFVGAYFLIAEYMDKK